MRAFGEIVRELRVAQDLGLREAAVKVGISPTYLSRIERGKEGPPRPDIIKELARLLAADPDVLFRLSAATDPEVTAYLNNSPSTLTLLRYIMEAGLSESQVGLLLEYAKGVRSQASPSESGNGPIS